MTSKKFRSFFMEDALEHGRFHAKFNAGESGGPAQSLSQIVAQIPGLTSEKASRALLDMPLSDSPNHGRADLRDAIAALHPGAQRENVLVTTGTSEALFLYFYLRTPRKVALILPGFQLLYELALVHNCAIIELPMVWSEKGHPEPPVDDWLDTLNHEKPDLVLFNHPHNPSGWVPDKHFIQKLQGAVDGWGGTLLGDEHYRFLVEGSTFNHSALPDQREKAESFPLGATLYRSDSQTIVTGSFIKCLGTPGLRIGWCVGPTDLISQMQNMKNYTTHTVNPYSEWVASLVLTDPTCSAFFAAREMWDCNRRALSAWITEQQLTSHGWLGAAPLGGWVTCLAYGGRFDPAELNMKLSDRGVFLLDLSLMEWKAFGRGSVFSQRPSFRLGLGLQPDRFEEMLASLSAI